MTDATLSHSATGSGKANATPLPGAGFYAAVIGGQLHLRIAGEMVPMTGWDATSILLMLEGSPYHESQERARQIKAALRETMQ